MLEGRLLKYIEARDLFKEAGHEVLYHKFLETMNFLHEQGLLMIDSGEFLLMVQNIFGDATFIDFDQICLVDMWVCFD